MGKATLAGGPARLATATLAGGCFWCTEAIFKHLKGVITVDPGYSGGNPPAGGKNPTYGQICSGTTGHAEAILIKFDPKIISYEKLLEVFFKLHDSTTLNRQGNNVGTEYRSAIFYHTEEQKKIAEEQKAKTQGSVTQIVPFTNFYPAENYHKNYYDQNRQLPYCQLVIDPKIQKLSKLFPKSLRESEG
ncbi:MAG: peptide-methionine (S)-S-oxide reductase MsrA [Candidatus Curtissbacteria bacterium]|nr:peptide-methionine (S)-S-oxide reductase MsrA [Candidatus Curtissbacteria bacterium]